MPTQTPTTDKFQCIPQCIMAPLDAFLAGNVAEVGFSALTPPYVIALHCLMHAARRVLMACRFGGLRGAHPTLRWHRVGFS